MIEGSYQIRSIGSRHSFHFVIAVRRFISKKSAWPEAAAVEV
jgi:hypothetical protein